MNKVLLITVSMLGFVCDGKSQSLDGKLESNVTLAGDEVSSTELNRSVNLRFDKLIKTRFSTELTQPARDLFHNELAISQNGELIVITQYLYYKVFKADTGDLFIEGNKSVIKRVEIKDSPMIFTIISSNKNGIKFTDVKSFWSVYKYDDHGKPVKGGFGMAKTPKESLFSVSNIDSSGSFYVIRAGMMYQFEEDQKRYREVVKFGSSVSESSLIGHNPKINRLIVKNDMKMDIFDTGATIPTWVGEIHDECGLSSYRLASDLSFYTCSTLGTVKVYSLPENKHISTVNNVGWQYDLVNQDFLVSIVGNEIQLFDIVSGKLIDSAKGPDPAAKYRTIKAASNVGVVAVRRVDGGIEVFRF